MNKLRMLSLCSGIGGADLAAEWTGAIEVVGQVEIDPYCQAVLAKHWPDVKRISDIREVQGDEFGAIDIIVGGIPCQPFSSAGKQHGTDDDRYLWPEMFRIVKNANPCWVVIENVDDFTYMALDIVQVDLEVQGYTVQAFVLPACAVGAPHIRERCFVVAHTTSSRRQECQDTERTHNQSNVPGIMADSYSDRQRIRQSESQHFTKCSSSPDPGIDGTQGIMADADGERSQIGDRCPAQGWARATADRCGAGQSQPGMGRSFTRVPDRMDSHRWPAGPGQEQEVWEPARISTKQREKYRGARLKALGNAIVPQQIYPVFEAIVAVEVTQP